MNANAFASLGLIEPILAALREEGYETPTPIQAESIPALIEGRDLLGIAQTGTGKTAAFALPLIQRLILDPKKRPHKSARVLVVAPTRELAAQIDASFAAYGRNADLARACVFGGVGSLPQEKALSRGVDVLVATPGRLLDLIDRGHLNLAGVESVVLDEADRMFDMGFIRDVRRIVSLLPQNRQTIFFSATMPPEIEAFADPMLRDPVRAAVPSTQPTADRVDQKVLFVAKEDKRQLLAAILKEDGFKRVIVFTKTKHGANRLAKQLAADGIPADAIHANKSQNQRTRTMDAFRSGGVDVLIATDLAARGIDVDDVELVVNYDLPNECETYVHRIGRTARAGAEGVAVSFCDAEERTLLRDIERFVGFRIPVELDHPYRLEIEPLRDPERQPPRRGRGEARPSAGPRRRDGDAGRRGDRFRGDARPGRSAAPSSEPSIADLFSGAASIGSPAGADPQRSRPDRPSGDRRPRGDGNRGDRRPSADRQGRPDAGRGRRDRGDDFPQARVVQGRFVDGRLVEGPADGPRGDGRRRDGNPRRDSGRGAGRDRPGQDSGRGERRADRDGPRAENGAAPRPVRGPSRPPARPRTDEGAASRASIRDAVRDLVRDGSFAPSLSNPAPAAYGESGRQAPSEDGPESGDGGSSSRRRGRRRGRGRGPKPAGAE